MADVKTYQNKAGDMAQIVIERGGPALYVKRAGEKSWRCHYKGEMRFVRASARSFLNVRALRAIG